MKQEWMPGNNIKNGINGESEKRFLGLLKTKEDDISVINHYKCSAKIYHIIHRKNGCSHHNHETVPGYTGWDTSWPGGDQWRCTERILVAVEGIDGRAWARGDWRCTKGGGGVERSPKWRRRVHGWSWCWAPNSWRTAWDRGCCRRRPVLRGRTARKIQINKIGTL